VQAQEGSEPKAMECASDSWKHEVSKQHSKFIDCLTVNIPSLLQRPTVCAVYGNNRGL